MVPSHDLKTLEPRREVQLSLPGLATATSLELPRGMTYEEWEPIGQDSIDEMLIREGLAKAWTRDGQHRDLLVGPEKEVQRQRSGCLR